MRFVLALAGTRRRVVHMKAIEQDDASHSESWERGVHEARADACTPLRVSSSLLGPADASRRALSGSLKFTVRRHKFNKDSLSPWAQAAKAGGPPPQAGPSTPASPAEPLQISVK